MTVLDVGRRDVASVVGQVLRVRGGEQSGAEEVVGGASHLVEVEVREVGDLDERGGPVGVGEGPQHRHHRVGCGPAAHGGVQAACTELRFAVRAQVDVRRVALEHVDDPAERLEGLLELVVGDEVQVVRGRVVLRVLAVRGPGQPPHRQVEADRVELPLVVPVRRVVTHLAGETAYDVGRGDVHGTPAVPGPLPHQTTATAEAGQDQTV